MTSPDEGALQRLIASLGDAERAGTVLIGPVGVGKTHLADAAAERFAADRRTDVARVAGTATARLVPFGAFAHLVDVGDAGKTADLLRAARRSLSSRPLIVIEDAHYLDRLSATLVYQLAADRTARLIVTVDSEELVPEAVSALWIDDLLTRIELSTDDARKDLRTRITEYLAGLPESTHNVLRYLAVLDPLRLSDLVALTSSAALDRSIAEGAVRIEPVGEDSIVYSGHPLYTDAVRGGLTDADARWLRSALIERLSLRPPGDVVARLRLATLALDSDTPLPVAATVTAATEALRLGDMELGERLARAALNPPANLPAPPASSRPADLPAPPASSRPADLLAPPASSRPADLPTPPASSRSSELSARLTLATALAWQGRGREAGDVLAPVNPAELSQTELMAWALPRAANQFWMLGEPTQAAAFLQTTRQRVSAPAARATLDALAATFAMNAGTPHQALRMADEVLASPYADDQAIGWAASAAALSAARIGRFDEVDPLAARASAAEYPGLLRFTSGFGRTTAMLMAGRLEEARALAQKYTDFAELQQPGRAIGEVLVAHVAIAQGDFVAAVKLLHGAAEALAPTGYSWGPLSLMLLAAALGQQGDRIGAAKVLSAAESRHGLKSALFAPELALAKAWTLFAREDVQGAIDAARDAVQAAERGGQSAVALRALHDAVRLGDTRAVYRTERLAGEVDCKLARLTLAHARALTARDADALAEVAAELAAVGLAPAAADAAAQAARVR